MGIRTRLVVASLALLIIGMVAAEALADPRYTGLALTCAAMGGVGVALLVFLGATLPLTRGLRALTHAAQRLAGGDADVQVPHGRGEIGELGKAFAQLAADLSRRSATMRHERDLMGGILEGMQDGVLLLDEDGRVALVNPSLRRTLFLPTEVVGKPPLEVIRHAELQELIARARKEREPIVSEIEIAGLKPRRLLVQVSHLINRPRMLLLVFLDVTQIRRLESMRRDFVANVSHELRTPVSAIRSAAETLLVGALADPAAAKMFVDIIDRNGARLQQLIEDLLDLSRIESRELRLQLEPIDLAEMAEHSAGLLREKAEKRRHQILVRVPDGLPRALADRRGLEQVLANLIDNAIKYCPDGARITARGTEVEDNKVEIAIEDTGPGIEERHLARLFERFYRIDPGRSRDMGGTGLGLSIVKHVVEAMGGQVGVSSKFGLGTTFWVRLPKAPVASSAVAKS
jgi:two-component system, OmpR family, phosphate regulon sensor histidine kinase PhoR